MTIMTTLRRERSWTVGERDALPDDGRRHEVLDGLLIVSAAPRPMHQVVLLGVYRQLFEACPPDRRVLVAPLDVRLAEDTVLEPDVLVARRDAFDDRGLPSPPELAVEVLSRSSRSVDRLLKFDRFRRAGTASYWLVDPDTLTLEAYELRGGDYELVAEVTGEDTWRATRPFDVVLDPSAWGA